MAEIHVFQFCAEERDRPDTSQNFPPRRVFVNSKGCPVEAYWRKGKTDFIRPNVGLSDRRTGVETKQIRGRRRIRATEHQNPRHKQRASKPLIHLSSTFH